MIPSKKLLLMLCAAAFFISLPYTVQSEYLINLMVKFFIYATIAESWNLLGGVNGQISLGHSSFFGIGALVTRLLWVSQVPIPLALAGGGLASILLAGVVGIPCLRMRRAYFPIGTLALAIIAEVTVSNILPVPGSLPSDYIVGYNVVHRYYFGLFVSALTVFIVFLTVRSRMGLALLAIRDDEGAAEAMGVKAVRFKVKALLISSLLASLGGGIFAYHQVSYYYASPFELSWSFLPTLITFVGGLGTIMGPIVGAVCFITLNELFAITLGEVHLIIFGCTFILIVLFLPGGLMSISRQIRLPRGRKTG